MTYNSDEKINHRLAHVEAFWDILMQIHNVDCLHADVRCMHRHGMHVI